MCGINVPITVTGWRDPAGAGLLGLTIFHASWIIGERLTAIVANVTVVPLPALLGMGAAVHRGEFGRVRWNLVVTKWDASAHARMDAANRPSAQLAMSKLT